MSVQLFIGDMDEFCESLFRLLCLATVFLPEDVKLPMLCEWTQAKGRIDFIKAELAKRGIPSKIPDYFYVSAKYCPSNISIY